MALVKERLKRLEDIKSGERTLLQEAHEMVVNEDYPDIPEALDSITDQENVDSLMHLMIEEENYERCAEILREKEEILTTIDDDE